jgi:H+-translocating NAD(P) transhydrogenase subunit alpha
MKVAIAKERRAHELRVAATPETVKKLKALGIDVVVESGAGMGSSYTDAAYAAVGAIIAPDYVSAVTGADVLFKVQRPLLAGEGEIDELAPLARGTAVIAQLSPFADGGSHLAAYAEAGIDGYAMELMPRITRAQSMDVLSSQSNLAGYKAVLEACSHFGRAFPMMMTAAGTVPPAKVFVMGVGVAGLQAIATARRLGAQVSATDVRPATKEQVESLGGKFVAVEDEEFKQAETAGGYAKEMSAAYQAKQRAFVSDHIAKMDIVICTALIPGRPAPELVTPEQVASMKQGSVIYDLAAEQGGNCKAGRLGEVVEVNGVKIVSSYNLPSRIAVDASALYSRNLLTFLTGFYDKDAGAMKVDLADDIIKGILLTRAGAIIHPRFAPATAAE